MKTFEHALRSLSAVRPVSVAICVALACPACSDQSQRAAELPLPVAAKSLDKTAEPAAREQIMTLTPRAAERLRLMRDNGRLKPNAVVRISVLEGNFFRLRNGGDKRYRYNLLLDDDPRDLENYVEMESQGLTIQIPKSSADFLRGTEVAWIDTGGKGGFKFQNPNELPDDEANADPAKLVPVADPENAKKGAGPTPIDE
jgi:Fe-S cluster assembly iron-binding protein IscA